MADRDFTPGGRDSNPGWPRAMVPYINGWINEAEKALALEGGMDKIRALLADLKQKACGELAEASAGCAPVPAVGQVMDVSLAKAAEQNYSYKGKKQYQPLGKPTKDSKTIEGPGAFEDLPTGKGVRFTAKGREYLALDMGRSDDPEDPATIVDFYDVETEKFVDRRKEPASFKVIVDWEKSDIESGDLEIDLDLDMPYGTTAVDWEKSSSKSGGVEELRSYIAKSKKLLEHWGKPNSAVAEQEEPAAAPEVAEPAPAPEPAAEPEAAEAPPVSIESAINDKLAHGIADGVVNSLAAVYGDMLDFTNADVLKSLAEIERQYKQKGNQFFTQLRAEVETMGPVERDRAVRSAVRVFRELA